MRFIKNTLFSVLLIFALQSCYIKKMVKMAKNQKLIVNPSPLELIGDSVKFSLSVELPTKMLKKNKNYRYTLTYKTADNRLTLGKIDFKGNDFPKTATENPKLKKNFSFLFSPDLVKGELLGQGYAYGLNDKGKKTPELPIAYGVSITSQLVIPVTPVSYADHGYSDKDEYLPSVINFYFDKKSTEINQQSLNSTEVKNFEKSIAKKYVTKNVVIIASNSPEGSFSYNAILSEQRAVAIEKFYKNMMKKYNYGSLADSISFTTKSQPQEWSYFKSFFMNNYTLTKGQKDTIEMIMTDKSGTIRSNEAKLHDLPYYKTIVDEVYNDLRMARTEAISLNAKKTFLELMDIAKKICTNKATRNDVLNEQELMYAAKMSSNKDDQEKLYKAATKLNDNWISHNNLGALYLEKAINETNSTKKNELAELALAQFEIARKNFESPVTLLNVASARLLTNDFQKADEYASLGLKEKPTENVLKGLNSIKAVTEIKKGNYQSAISLLSNGSAQNEVLFNKGLAQLLIKDYPNAQISLVAASDFGKNQPIMQYVTSICFARQNNELKSLEYLKNAINLDNSLLKRSTEDIEFNNMFKLDSFKKLLN